MIKPYFSPLIIPVFANFGNMNKGINIIISLIVSIYCCSLSVIGQESDLIRFETELISGRNPNLAQELKKKTEEPSIKIDAIVLSKYLSLLGDYYQSKSDIGLAKQYWDKSAQTLTNKFGQNSIYNASKYNNLSKYYGFLIKSDSAIYFSEKAISLCRHKKDSLKFIRVDKIYKQYGHALKVKHIQDSDVLNGTVIARKYLDSAIYFNKKYSYGGGFNNKLNVDIGNTFTDEIIDFQRLGKKNEAYSCLKKANFYYDSAIKDMPNEFGKTNQFLSNIYFVKGLTFLYCFVNDSLTRSLENYQRGLIALTPNYNDTSILSCPLSNSNFLNESQTLVLLHFKIDALNYLYIQTKNTKYLSACYEHSKVAFEIWERFFTNLKTEEIHRASEIYGAAPFGSSIYVCSEYYQITKDKKVAEEVFSWMELNKYSVLLKQQLDNEAISFKTNPIDIKKTQNELKNNQAVIEYYYGANGFDYAVITKNNFELNKLNLNFRINSKIDSLIVSLKKHEAEKYCKQSKELYDLILKPILTNLSSNINELIIIPHEKLFNIPFEALVTNEAKTYKQADFLIKHYQISYGLSCNLLFNDGTNNASAFNSIIVLNPEFKDKLALPFSNELTEQIKKDYTTIQFNFQGKTKNSLLHFATHAYCNFDDSRNSYLLLNKNDKLYLKELKSKIPPSSLAVLSACETGNGSVELGEGVVNFSRQFYLAGIKSTITTLWKVDDEATSEILRRFYAELKNGKNSVEAMHKSKLSYLNNVKSIDDYDPYYWAGIIYTGNPVIYEKKSNNKWIWYSLVSLSLLGVLIFFRKKFF